MLEQAKETLKIELENKKAELGILCYNLSQTFASRKFASVYILKCSFRHDFHEKSCRPCFHKYFSNIVK